MTGGAITALVAGFAIAPLTASADEARLPSPAATLQTDVNPETPSDQTPLEADVLRAVAGAEFSRVYDFANDQVTAQTPQVDVAVIELDEQGHIRDRANVLVSRDYPHGVIAPIDENLDSSSVRWLRWDQNRFDGSGVYGEGTELVPDRTDAPLQYMSTYPASLLKSMVAFGLVFLSDHQAIDLTSNYTYNGVSKPIQQWTAEMIQMSNNTSAQAMIKYLHEVTYQGQSGIEFLNSELKRLGLSTLQIEGTNPDNGGNWSNGGVTMTAFDTARLDLLLDGGDGGLLWTTADGTEVNSDVLTNSGRQWLLDIWSGSAYHWMLDTGNFCNWTTPYTGATQYPAKGIPAVVPESSLNPDGTSKIQWDGSPFATVDVRACNATAEVTYYNKYGLTYNAGSDAGIVKSLPNKPFRHYVIAVMSNLGYRYGDAALAPAGNPCLNDAVSAYCYTERFPIMAAQLDSAMKRRGSAADTTPQVTSVTPVSVQTTVGTAPPLPGTVTVELSDFSAGTRVVTWENTDPSAYSAPGTYTVNGVVGGTDVPATATVTVQAAPVTANETSTIVSAPSVRYGKAGKATVTVRGAGHVFPTGSVTLKVSKGSAVVQQLTVPLVAGQATATLAKREAGTYKIVAEYRATSAFNASTSPASTFKVTRANAKVAISGLPTKVKKKAMSKVKVTTAKGISVSGTVQITVRRGKTLIQKKLVHLTKASTSVRLARFAKVGTYKVSVKYSGTRNVAAASTTKTLKVKQ